MSKTTTLTTSAGSILVPVATDRLRDQINAGHALIQSTSRQARDLAERAAQFAVIEGLLLMAAKAQTPHGQWESLFQRDDENKPNRNHGSDFKFSVRTARKYIAAAEGALARPGLSAAAKGRILGLVKGGEIPAQLSDQLRKDLEQATAGQTLRQLYIDLEIIRADATERRTLTGGSGSDDDDNPGAGAENPGKGSADRRLVITPEEAWQLAGDPVGRLRTFFSDKTHCLLERERAEELAAELETMLAELRALTW